MHFQMGYTSKMDILPFVLQTVMESIVLRAYSICVANGHLSNPTGLCFMISIVGLPWGFGTEELGNINRKMTSSKEHHPAHVTGWPHGSEPISKYGLEKEGLLQRLQ